VQEKSSHINARVYSLEDLIPTRTKCQREKKANTAKDEMQSLAFSSKRCQIRSLFIKAQPPYRRFVVFHWNVRQSGAIDGDKADELGDHGKPCRPLSSTGSPAAATCVDSKFSCAILSPK
jgi:hypothetical protein